MLPRLKQGKDLRRGLLGITPQGTDVYNAAPVIGAIQPDSAAARAGMQVGDKIVEINGKTIPNYSTLQHVLGPMYEGDEVTVKVMRGDKEQEFKGVKLLGTVDRVRQRLPRHPADARRSGPGRRGPLRLSRRARPTSRD